jgi:hypothetical protein
MRKNYKWYLLSGANLEDVDSCPAKNEMFIAVYVFLVNKVYNQCAT